MSNQPDDYPASVRIGNGDVLVGEAAAMILHVCPMHAEVWEVCDCGCTCSGVDGEYRVGTHSTACRWLWGIRINRNQMKRRSP